MDTKKLCFTMRLDYILKCINRCTFNSLCSPQLGGPSWLVVANHRTRQFPIWSNSQNCLELEVPIIGPHTLITSGSAFHVPKWMFVQKVVVLTGAGISAESGIPTFRGEGGLWRSFDATVSWIYQHIFVNTYGLTWALVEFGPHALNSFWMTCGL